MCSRRRQHLPRAIGAVAAIRVRSNKTEERTGAADEAAARDKATTADAGIAAASNSSRRKRKPNRKAIKGAADAGDAADRVAADRRRAKASRKTKATAAAAGIAAATLVDAAAGAAILKGKRKLRLKVRPKAITPKPMTARSRCWKCRKRMRARSKWRARRAMSASRCEAFKLKPSDCARDAIMAA